MKREYIIYFLILLGGCTLHANSLFINKSDGDRVIFRDDSEHFLLGKGLSQRYHDFEKQKKYGKISIINCTKESILEGTCSAQHAKAVGNFNEMIEELEKRKRETGRVWVYVIENDDNITIRPYEDVKNM